MTLTRTHNVNHRNTWTECGRSARRLRPERRAGGRDSSVENGDAEVPARNAVHAAKDVNGTAVGSVADSGGAGEAGKFSRAVGESEGRET